LRPTPSALLEGWNMTDMAHGMTDVAHCTTDLAHCTTDTAHGMTAAGHVTRDTGHIVSDAVAVEPSLWPSTEAFEEGRPLAGGSPAWFKFVPLLPFGAILATAIAIYFAPSPWGAVAAVTFLALWVFFTIFLAVTGRLDRKAWRVERDEPVKPGGFPSGS
jgi:hypothetical protein